jgi:hypothetical protein
MSTASPTKEELFRAILNAIDSTIQSIDTHTEAVSDYKFLQQLFEYLGVNKELFDETLNKYNFKSWEDFHGVRNGIYADLSRIEPVIGYLKGLAEGAKNKISRELMDIQNTPVHAG